MDRNSVKEKLIEIIEEIQTKSALECPPLDGNTMPHQDVPKFDSKIGIAATSKLVKKLGVDIPDDTNIFANEATQSMLTIDQTVALVCDIAKVDNESGVI